MRLVHYGSDHFDSEKFTPVKNSNYRNKPESGGLWASPVNKKKWTWSKWCRREDFRTDTLNVGFKFDINFNSPRILKIFNLEDMEQLRKYIIHNEISAIHEQFHTDGSFSGFEAYDFEAMSKDYDALYVEAGSGRGLYDAMYGWDCDSILIMNPAIMKFPNTEVPSDC